MATPEEIAKLITDDPDIFNEMAVGTGGIAMGPMQALGTPAPKKKKRKSVKREDDGDIGMQKMHKQYYADPVTGQSKSKGSGKSNDGEVLYSDTQTEEPEKALGESSGDQARIAQLASITLESPPLDQWSHGEEMNDGLRKKILGSFRKAFGSMKQIVDRLPGGCALAQSWAQHLEYIQHLRKSDAQQTRNPVEWEGNPIETPPKGWWGQKWGVSSSRNYILSFFYEVLYEYLSKFQELQDEHLVSCDDEQCMSENHQKWVIKALCADIVGFSDIWDILRTERAKAFTTYRYYQKRGTKQIRHQMSKDDQDRLAQWKAKPAHERGPVMGELPDTMSQLANWYKDHPKGRRSVFSSGFGEPTFKKGDRVEHAKYGPGQVVSTPKEIDVFVRVMFDTDLQTAFGQIGPGVAHNVKVKRVRKAHLETQY